MDYHHRLREIREERAQRKISPRDEALQNAVVRDTQEFLQGADRLTTQAAQIAAAAINGSTELIDRKVAAYLNEGIEEQAESERQLILEGKVGTTLLMLLKNLQIQAKISLLFGGAIGLLLGVLLTGSIATLLFMASNKNAVRMNQGCNETVSPH